MNFNYFFVIVSIVQLSEASHENNTKIRTGISVLRSDYNVTSDVDKICEFKKCIYKCCPTNEYVVKHNACSKYNRTLSLSNMVIYDENYHKTNKLFEYIFTIVPGRFSNEEFNQKAVHSGMLRQIDMRPYLKENGVLYVEIPNAYNRWQIYGNDRFCVDYQLFKAKPPELRLWVHLYEDEQQEPNIYITAAMLVSCVFLVLVLIVYALLPELRNLGGMILMAYVASLFMAFLLLAIIQSDKYVTDVCIGLTYTIYFSFLASFCWMSVMSYDIWWTFRGYAKARPIHRRGEHFKFAMYCLYAWGVPLLMTIMLAVLNKADLRSIPWFITPNVPKMGCFLRGGQMLVYLHIPMLILIIFNWIFFLMTAFNVWRLSRGTSVLNSPATGTSAAHRSQRHRFLVYLKLSTVMGLSWVLEVGSVLVPNLKVWYISDWYNVLMGVAIFLIFVCKVKIFHKLKKQFRAQKKLYWFPRSKGSMSSSSDSTSSQETQTLQVCSNPKGPGYQMKSF